jgi:hypothetical protein
MRKFSLSVWRIRGVAVLKHVFKINVNKGGVIWGPHKQMGLLIIMQQDDWTNTLISIKPYICCSGKVASPLAYLLPHISNASTLYKS